ncbi:MAG: PAS domain S-box protein [Acidobacteria bacterium]|nr:PAS domain S-box protein [Acidobacteriota bacterium]
MTAPRKPKALRSTTASKETELQSQAGEWYPTRILPYRTLEGETEGAVVTFAHITARKQPEETVRMSDRRLATLVLDSHDAMTMQDLEGRILAWNPAAAKMYGWSETEALAMNVRELIPQLQRHEELDVVRRLSRSEILEPYRAQRLTKDGATMDVMLTATALLDHSGKGYAVAATERLLEGGRRG